MIIVDIHEIGSGVPEALSRMTETVVQPLETSDYFWYDIDGHTIMVERKEIGDFLNSIVDGRLEDQVNRIKAAADVPVVMVEGIPFADGKKVAYLRQLKKWRDGVMMAPFRSTDFNTVGYLGQLWALGYSAGVIIMPTSSAADSALLLSVAYNSSQKECHGSLYTGTRWLSSKASPVLGCLATFPNLGVKKAQRVLSHFGTLAAVCEADIPELMKVEGIGEITARAIWEFVRGRK